jgi:hypothetical protein
MTTTESAQNSELSSSRPGDFWGASEMEGTFREWSYGISASPSRRFSADRSAKKIFPMRLIWAPSFH